LRARLQRRQPLRIVGATIQLRLLAELLRSEQPELKFGGIGHLAAVPGRIEDDLDPGVGDTGHRPHLLLSRPSHGESVVGAPASYLVRKRISHPLEASMGVLSATRHVWSADNLPLACLIGQAITDLKLHRQDADRGEWFSHPWSPAESSAVALEAASCYPLAACTWPYGVAPPGVETLVNLACVRGRRYPRGHYGPGISPSSHPAQDPGRAPAT